MATQPIARLTRAGILGAHQGILQMTDPFLAHLSLFRHRGGVPSWDILAVLEMALSTWHEYPGDARESARHLVRFLPSGSISATPAFPVLDAFIAA
ncbi:MAG: hypothetical protein ABR562_02585 [Thermoplasmatota archaeon]|nr:hypothetical protein [Halobacteriales archaeon]